jgi:hypothetical protein
MIVPTIPFKLIKIFLQTSPYFMEQASKSRKEEKEAKNIL